MNFSASIFLWKKFLLVTPEYYVEIYYLSNTGIAIQNFNLTDSSQLYVNKDQTITLKKIRTSKNQGFIINRKYDPSKYRNILKFDMFSKKKGLLGFDFIVKKLYLENFY